MRSDEVQYPVLRADLEQAARDFADQAFQTSVWANPTTDGLEGRWDLLEGFSFVVDDLGTGDLDSMVGQVLVNEEELQLYADLHGALSSVGRLERSTSRIEYHEVANTEEWATVQRAAAHLFQAMKEADSRP